MSCAVVALRSVHDDEANDIAAMAKVRKNRFLIILVVWFYGVLMGDVD